MSSPKMMIFPYILRRQCNRLSEMRRCYAPSSAKSREAIEEGAFAGRLGKYERQTRDLALWGLREGWPDWCQE